MPKFIDLTGQRFGNWLVLKKAISDNHGNDRWFCRCGCGLEKVVVGNNLRRGGSQQCSSCAKIIHGFAKTKLYKVWICMIDRCENSNHLQYEKYGGRGIKICSEWHNFIVFRKWALEHKYKYYLTMDRINNEKGYFPENCRFATSREQQRNRRDNRYLKIGNEVKLLCEWAEKTGINYQVLWQRIKRGWSGNKLLEPVQRR